MYNDVKGLLENERQIMFWRPYTIKCNKGDVKIVDRSLSGPRADIEKGIISSLKIDKDFLKQDFTGSVVYGFSGLVEVYKYPIEIVSIPSQIFFWLKVEIPQHSHLCVNSSFEIVSDRIYINRYHLTNLYLGSPSKLLNLRQVLHYLADKKGIKL